MPGLRAMKVYSVICEALRNRHRVGQSNLDHRLSIRYVFIFHYNFCLKYPATTLGSCAHDLHRKPCRSSYTSAIEMKSSRLDTRSWITHLLFNHSYAFGRFRPSSSIAVNPTRESLCLIRILITVEERSERM